MKDNMYKIPSFEQLKEYYTKYRMIDKDCDSIEKVKVLERGSNIEVADLQTKTTAYMALRWEEIISRGTVSFNDENKEIYNDIINRIIRQMRDKNMIDTIDLLRDVYDDEYKRNIIINLFSDQNKARILSEYFYKALNHEGTYFAEATALFTEEYADKLLNASRRK